MSTTQKISNPFFKPSPFRSASPFDNVPNNKSPYSAGNFYESNVSPFVSASNNQFSRVPISNGYSPMNQYKQLKPTRDYEFSKDTGIETLLEKNPFKKASLLDGANLNPTYNNYIDFGSNKYARNQNLGYQRLDNYPTTHHTNNYHDNKSDAGSVNTYINKIYQIQDHNKYSGLGNPEKLSNPFGRKHLITTQSYIPYEDPSDYGLNKKPYNPGYNNYVYKKEDYSSAEVPQMKLNFDYEGSSIGTPRAKAKNFDGQMNIHYHDSQLPNLYSKNTESQKILKIDGHDEYPYNQYGSKKFYSEANEHQNKNSRYDSRFDSKKELPYDQTFKANGFQKNEQSKYNYKINYQTRESPQNIQSRVQQYGNYHAQQRVEFQKNSDYEQQPEGQSYKPPAFGGAQIARNILQGVNRPNVPKVIKFDADDSEQSRIKPDIYSSRKDQAVRQAENYPSILQIKGRLYHKIQTS